MNIKNQAGKHLPGLFYTVTEIISVRACFGKPLEFTVRGSLGATFCVIQPVKQFNGKFSNNRQEFKKGMCK
jgi:hypothetical protein